jgi:hypothetical protein
MTGAGEISAPGDDPKTPEVRASQSAERQQIVRHQTEMGFGFKIEPAKNPLLDKLTEDQITKLIDQDGDEASGRRWLRWGVLLGGIIAFVVLSWMFLEYQQAPMLEKVLTHLMAFFGGAGVGWGITRKK